jgi:hypothetical protein
MSTIQILGLIEQSLETGNPLPDHLTRADLEAARAATGRADIIDTIDNALQGMGE